MAYIGVVKVFLYDSVAIVSGEYGSPDDEHVREIGVENEEDGLLWEVESYLRLRAERKRQEAERKEIEDASS